MYKLSTIVQSFCLIYGLYLRIDTTSATQPRHNPRSYSIPVGEWIARKFTSDMLSVMSETVNASSIVPTIVFVWTHVCSSGDRWEVSIFDRTTDPFRTRPHTSRRSMWTRVMRTVGRTRCRPAYEAPPCNSRTTWQSCGLLSLLSSLDSDKKEGFTVTWFWQ